MQLKKILIIDNSLYVTGALKSILNFTEQLSDEFEFEFVMCLGSYAATTVEALGYIVHRLPLLEISRSWSALIYIPRLLVNTYKLKKLMQKRSISVLHVNDLYNQLGVLSKFLTPTLFVVYHVRLVHPSYLGKFYGIFAKLVLAKADRIICVSNVVYSYFEGNKKVTIVSDGLIKKESLSEKKYWENLPICKVLYLANYVRGKGQNFALKALAIALNSCPNIQLKFVGSTNSNPLQEEYLSELKMLSVLLGIQSNVFFSGFSSDVESEVKAADVVLNLSESESFSMVCLEALSYGAPLIASDCGGPSELFENNISGILIPNRDFVSAANALLDLINYPNFAEAIGKNGKMFVRHKFDQDILLSKMRMIYHS